MRYDLKRFRWFLVEWSGQLVPTWRTANRQAGEIERIILEEFQFLESLALFRKSPEINGAGEGNRTLVIITKGRFVRKPPDLRQKGSKTPTFQPTDSSQHQLLTTDDHSDPH